MEKNRREPVMLAAMAELFDLPPDLLAGLPRVEMAGDRQMYIERHLGLLSYSGEQIEVNTVGGVLRIRGRELTLTAMTGEEVRIGGRISGVEWIK